MTKEEASNLCSLSVENFMAILNSSSQEEVVDDVRNVIKEHFKSVSDKWLVSGLLDYYFQTNSKRILDLLMGAPEPHWKYLLEKIHVGIKGNEKFRFLSILLYAVSRNSPPIWIYKIPNILMKDLLDILSPSKESDINVLVSGVMIIVFLLPAMPYGFNKYLIKVFQCFWKLVHWTPYQEHDIALRPYLQVAVYSLFQRLYALYPCNLLGFLRVNMVGQTKQSWYLSTLKPMLERIRFHPLLVSETKDTEISKNRWVGIEPNALLHECAKLCLDPLHEICDELYVSKSSNRHSLYDNCADNSYFLVLCSSENNFWSPGAVQSPSTANASIPHTPVYTYQLLSSTGIVESPPEAAIEATPETTPFTSPLTYLLPRSESKMGQHLPKLKNTPLGDISAIDSRSPIPLSPTNKDTFPVKFPQKQGQIGFEKSEILQTKLQEIQRQRQNRQKEGDTVSSLLEYLKVSENDTPAPQNNSKISSESLRKLDDKTDSFDIDLGKVGFKRRKIAINDSRSSEDSRKSDFDLFCEKNFKEESFEKSYETESSEATEYETPGTRDSEDSEANNSEGLGLPSKHSMTELIKNVKTNRIRFLSQCGPPPNICFSENGTKRAFSHSTIDENRGFKLKQKCRSFPDLLVEKPTAYSLISKQLSVSNSPIKSYTETTEIATQTEEGPVIDPYEQISELLSGCLRNYNKESRNIKGNDALSPYEILDQYIEESCCSVYSTIQETGYIAFNKSLNDTGKNHLRAMQCIMTLERYKRDAHAGRNRRMLSKIKKLHLLQEKDISSYKEKQSMKEEIMHLHQNLLKLQEDNNFLENKMDDMVEKNILKEVQEKQNKTAMQRDQLKMKYEDLQKEKLKLMKELEESRNLNNEFEKKIKIHSQHSDENVLLRDQVNESNKRMFLMGEIQTEMHQQLKNYKESQRHYRQQLLAAEKAAFSEKIQQLEFHRNEQKTSLDAAMYRIKELTKKLEEQRQHRLNHEKEINSVVSAWEERHKVLEKRNKNLYSINITLEKEINQLKKFQADEGRGGAGSQASAASSNMQRGFPQSRGSRETFSVPESNPNSFMSRHTSNEFKPFGSPTPYE